MLPSLLKMICWESWFCSQNVGSARYLETLFFLVWLGQCYFRQICPNQKNLFDLCKNWGHLYTISLKLQELEVQLCLEILISSQEKEFPGWKISGSVRVRVAPIFGVRVGRRGTEDWNRNLKPETAVELIDNFDFRRTYEKKHVFFVNTHKWN